tara:strand:- start:2459 stop:3817 length:1359 start_codon:yes stop_codon:yes gene_type:complete
MFLGIDLGATYCKVVLIDSNKNIIYSSRRRMPPPLKNRKSFIFEYDINIIINTVYDIVLEIPDNQRKKVDGIGVTGQMHGIILLDSFNSPVTNYISWQDKRALDNINHSNDTYLNFIHSNLPNLKASTYTNLRPGTMGLLLFWFQEKSYLEKLKVSSAAFLSDYLVTILTGNSPACDPTNASGSGVYELDKDGWCKDFLLLTKINESILPKIIPTGSFFGRVTYDVSNSLGLKKDTPVMVSIGDYQAALNASGFNENQISINVGTGAQVSVMTKNKEKFSDVYELRPYISNKYIKCIPGLPGGRSIEVFNNFSKNFFETFSSELTDIDFLVKLEKICLQIDDDIDVVCNPRFHSIYNFINENAGFKNINSNNFKIENLYYSLISSLVSEYFHVSKNLNYSKKNIKEILLSGGVTHKSKLFRKILLETFKIDLKLSNSLNDAAMGVATLAMRM